MLNEIYFTVDGMECSRCEAWVKAALKAGVGVKSAEASYRDKTVHVIYDGRRLTETDLSDIIEDGGYDVTSQKPGHCKTAFE